MKTIKPAPLPPPSAVALAELAAKLSGDRWRWRPSVHNRCRCHDPVVFGHRPPCSQGVIRL